MQPITPPHARYLATTDFSLIYSCIEAGLSPMQYRIVHFFNSCLAHDVDMDLEQAAKWLEISQTLLEFNLKILTLKGILNLDFTGEK